uniref:glycosyltransferase family 8 protein n=1 Tax=Helicobacter acinonychis TaxID=212 RepID=UPI002D78F49A
MDGLSAENIEKLKETLAPFSAFSSVEFLEISTHNTPKENQEIKKNQTIESDHYQNIDPIIANKIEELFTKLSASSQKRFSKMIMCRLLLASLFPQYDKMIMFDVDTLFVGDISESFFIPLDEHYFGMVKEWKCEAYVEFPSFVKCRKHDAELGLCDADKLVSLEEAKIIHSYFFNCGFMSINLALWRKDNLEKCFYEFILLRGAGFCCPEQD